MTRHSPVPRDFIPQLDGVRGIAIILVVTYHYWGYLPVFAAGWSGVDLFFVLSGYLITSRLVAVQHRPHPLQQFYTNRALRILPLYFGTLLMFYLGFHLLVRHQNSPLFEFYNQHWISYLLFVQNWLLPHVNETRPVFLLHFWSLAVEEQFYLIWPVFLYTFWTKKYFTTAVFLIVGLILIARTAIYFHYPVWRAKDIDYYITFCRMDAFFIGGLLFLFQSRHKAGQFIPYFILAFLLTAGGIWFSGNAKNNNAFFCTIGYTFLDISFAGLLYAAINHSRQWLSQVLNYRWLRFTGKISYGLYIFHWIVLQVLEPKITQHVFLPAGLGNRTAFFLSSCICLVISYLISIISYNYFESFFLRRKLR